MTLDSLLAQFGARTGLEGLKLNEDGVCRLVFDEALTVDVEASQSGEEATLVAVVGDLAPEASRATLAKLLSANLMGRDTGGASLALDVLTDEVILCRTLPLDGLSPKSFEAAVQAFVEALEHWSDEIEADDGEGPDPAPGSATSIDSPDFTILRV